MSVNVELEVLCNTLFFCNSRRDILFSDLKTFLQRLYALHMQKPFRDMKTTKFIFPTCKVTVVKCLLRWVTFIDAALEVYCAASDVSGMRAVDSAVKCLCKHNCVMFVLRAIIASPKDVICKILKILDAEAPKKKKLGLSSLKRMLADVVDTSETRPALWKLRTETRKAETATAAETETAADEEDVDAVVTTFCSKLAAEKAVDKEGVQAILNVVTGMWKQLSTGKLAHGDATEALMREVTSMWNKLCAEKASIEATTTNVHEIPSI